MSQGNQPDPPGVLNPRSNSAGKNPLASRSCRPCNDDADSASTEAGPFQALPDVRNSTDRLVELSGDGLEPVTGLKHTVRHETHMPSSAREEPNEG